MKTSASFPDISGQWTMLIEWNHKDKRGDLLASAVIDQNPSGISMDVHSKGSDSHTIMALPGGQAAGSPTLHYMYQVEPHATGSDATTSYQGAAILRYYKAADELRGNYWTSELSRGHFTLSRKPDGRESLIDILLIAAIPEEFEAAKATFTARVDTDDGVRDWQAIDPTSSFPYYQGRFDYRGQPLFSIAIAQSPRMGGITTGQLAAVLVERLKPKAVVMCGVCAGNPGDVALGDVVVSELAYQYDEGRRTKEGFEPDHRQQPASRQWKAAAKALNPADLPSYGIADRADARYWLMEQLHRGADPLSHPARDRYFGPGEWAAMINELRQAGILKSKGVLALTRKGIAETRDASNTNPDPLLRLPFAIKAGPIASGNVVVKDGITWDMLKRHGVRSVIGLEMEAAAIGYAAISAEVADWIVIKGVMDHADPNKDDRYKSFAARASAEVLRALLVDRSLAKAN
jgi:nucleoside phosphorylase